MTTEPDDALLWAREHDARQYEEVGAPALAQISREGGNDSCVVADLAEAYRAGHAARDAQIVAWLRKKARLYEGSSTADACMALALLVEAGEYKDAGDA